MKLQKDFPQYYVTLGIGKKGSDVMVATGQAPSRLSKTILRSWKGRMEAERCLQKGAAGAAELSKGNTVAAVTRRQSL